MPLSERLAMLACYLIVWGPIVATVALCVFPEWFE